MYASVERTIMAYYSQQQEQPEDLKEFIRETGVKRTPVELRILQILEARHNLREAYESYNLKKERRLDTSSALSYIRVRLKTLIFELEGWLKRTYSEQDFKSLNERATSRKADVVLDVVHELNIFLDKHKLIKIDVEQYDTTDPAIEDQLKGYG